MYKRLRQSAPVRYTDEVASFPVAGQVIAVARIGDRLYAVEDCCCHAGCPLSEGLLEDTVILCPRHAAGFELTTEEPTNLPAEPPIRCFKVTIEVDDF